jgi:hypothetical protein
LLAATIGHTVKADTDCTDTILINFTEAIVDGEVVSIERPFPQEMTGWTFTSNVYYTQANDEAITLYRVRPDGTTDLAVDMPVVDEGPYYSQIAPMPDEDFVAVSTDIINMYAEGSERISTILIWMIDVKEQALLHPEPIQLEFEAMDNRSLISVYDMRFSSNGTLLVGSITQPQEEQLGTVPAECLLEGRSTCYVDIIDFDPTTTRWHAYWLNDGSGEIIHHCRGDSRVCRTEVEAETIRPLELPVSNVYNMTYLPCDNAIAGWLRTSDGYSLFTYDLDDGTLTRDIVTNRERRSLLSTLNVRIPEAWLDD